MTDVDYAIFETNGKISVMKKEPKQSVTKNDMNISSKKKLFPISTEVISDGKVLKKNLSKLKLDTDWLEKQLKQSGINSVSNVFYAEVQQDGTLFVDSKQNFSK